MDTQPRTQQTETITITFFSPRIVMVTPREGIEIDRKAALSNTSIISQEMSSSYGMIIDRKADYSLAPVQVYDLLNSIDALKAIAIVVHNKDNFLPISIEQNLFKGPLNLFESVDAARAWLEEVMDNAFPDEA